MQTKGEGSQGDVWLQHQLGLLLLVIEKSHQKHCQAQAFGKEREKHPPLVISGMRLALPNYEVQCEHHTEFPINGLGSFKQDQKGWDTRRVKSDGKNS